MREIKFKGLRKDGRGWVYGDLLHTEKDFEKVVQIIDWSEKPYIHDVISETVGQSTGMKDKNGNAIFEGDIIDIYPTPNQIVRNCIVYFSGGGFRVKMEGKLTQFFERFTFLHDNKIPIEVKGNIFENKELIEK